MYASKFKCINCESEYSINEAEYTCKKCGGNLDIIYDYNKIKKILNVKILRQRDGINFFKYRELYPIDFNEKNYNKLTIGGTPLYKSELLGNYIGYNKFYIKDDSHNPSGSFKDRASIMALINAKEKGKKVIAGASTGNAASSLACLSAAIGMKNIIFIPKTAPTAKVAQLLIFGANLIMIDGNYDTAFDMSLQATEKFKIYNRNTGYNPFTREGKKSVSFEIIEQLNFKVPEYVFVPMGDGNIISGVWKGFKDFYNINIIDKLPKIIGVQSEKSSAIVDAYLENRSITPVKATTIADSISVDLPRDGDAALIAIRESNGFGIKISDNKILEAQKILAEKRGIFAEPAGATALAGLIKSIKENKIDKEKESIIIVTGNGLKDINSVIKNITMPKIFSPKQNLWEQEVQKYVNG